MGFISRYITPLVINSLESTHKYTHTDFPEKQFQETKHVPATGQYMPGFIAITYRIIVTNLYPDCRTMQKTQGQ